MRRKGQLVIVLVVTLMPLGIKLSFVFGLGFQCYGLFPVFREREHTKMLSILWNSWASIGKEMARTPLSWWLEGRINKVPRAPVQGRMVNQRLSRREEL